MGLILFAIVLIVFVWIINRWNNRAFVRLAYEIPSNRLHTLLGWGKLLSGKDIISSMYNYGKKYGPNSVFWMGPFPVFLSTDPQVINEIFTSKNCLNKPAILYEGLTITAGQGLITANEPIWSRHRKLLNKAFSNKNLLSFFPIFHKEIKSLIQQINVSLEKGDDIDMLVLLRELTLKNATQTTLKRNLDLTRFNSTSMSKHMESIQEFIADISLNKILSINWIRKLAELFIYKSASYGVYMFRELVEESLDIVEQKDTTDPSYLPNVSSALDLAVNAKQQNMLNLDEIHGCVMHLFSAAFETTSSTLFFVLSMLAMHPEYQERAYEEIMDILPDDDSEMTVEQMDQLSYLEMVLNETMRILSTIPMVFREVSNEDLILSNGLTLAVGQIICIDILSLHRSTDVWGPEANAFNPDNFLPSNISARHPFSFIPFTKGLRICIGWRYATLFSKIALATLIKTYKFSTDFKYKDLTFINHITLKLDEVPRLHMERR